MIKDLIEKALEKFPELKRVWDEVDPNIKWDQLQKPRFVALIGAIIGQKIKYEVAKELRQKIYEEFGDNFTEIDLKEKWVILESILKSYPDKINIIKQVCVFNFDVNNYWYQLKSIDGIGDYTIITTKITSGSDTNLFPTNDLFLRRRLQRFFNLPKLPTIGQTKQLIQRWDGHLTAISWLFWRWF